MTVTEPRRPALASENRKAPALAPAGWGEAKQGRTESGQLVPVGLGAGGTTVNSRASEGRAHSPATVAAENPLPAAGPVLSLV